MIRWALLAGLRKGLLGGSRFWLVVGGVAATIRILKKLGGSEPEVVLSERLGPGQAILVTHEAVTFQEERRERRERRRRRRPRRS